MSLEELEARYWKEEWEKDFDTEPLKVYSPDETKFVQIYPAKRRKGVKDFRFHREDYSVAYEFKLSNGLTARAEGKDAKYRLIAVANNYLKCLVTLKN